MLGEARLAGCFIRLLATCFFLLLIRGYDVDSEMEELQEVEEKDYVIMSLT